MQIFAFACGYACRATRNLIGSSHCNALIGRWAHSIYLSSLSVRDSGLLVGSPRMRHLQIAFATLANRQFLDTSSSHAILAFRTDWVRAHHIPTCKKTSQQAVVARTAPFVPAPLICTLADREPHLYALAASAHPWCGLLRLLLALPGRFFREWFRVADLLNGVCVILCCVLLRLRLFFVAGICESERWRVAGAVCGHL